MDTPKRYVIMCDDPRIQRECEFQDGDWFAIDRDENFHVWVLNKDHRNYENAKKFIRQWHHIWLPRQDQYQILLRRFYSMDIEEERPDKWFPEGHVGMGFVLDKFHEFADHFWKERSKSIEELYLRCYMAEVFDAIWMWRGRKWVGLPKRKIPITPVKGSYGHKEKMVEINKRLKDPDARKKQRKNLEEMKKLGSG